MAKQTKNRYRVVAMLPTEVYLDAETIDDAASMAEWLLDQYPTVDMPMSTEKNIYGAAVSKIVTIEAADKNDTPKE